jgi:hypothetical protein
MQDPGKLLFRVDHRSSLKGGMAAHGKIISSLYQMIRAKEGYDGKSMDCGIDAWPYEVAFGRLSANEAPIQWTGVECPSSVQPDVERIEQRDNPQRQK